MFSRLSPRVVCRRHLRRRLAPSRLDGQAATLSACAAGAVSILAAVPVAPALPATTAAPAILPAASAPLADAPSNQLLQPTLLLPVRRFCKPAVSCLGDGQLRDPAVLVEGLGSLSLSPPDVSGDARCTDVVHSEEKQMPERTKPLQPALVALELLSACTANLSSQHLPAEASSPPPCSSAIVELVPETPSLEQLVPELGVAVSAAEDATGCVGREEAPWELVQSRRSLRRKGFAPPAVKIRPPPPAWLNGRCLRCHEAGHWAAMCCEPLRCNNCRQVGHKARGCTGRTAPRPPPVHVRRAAQMPDDVRPRPGQRSPRPQQPEPPRQPADVQLQSFLAAQAELLRCELRGCLARVQSFLVRAEAALGRASVEPDVSSPSELHVASVVDKEANFYGCFSPRARHCPSLQPIVSADSESEFIEGGMVPAPLQPMVQLELGSLGPSGVASMPPSLEPNQRGGLGNDVFLLPESGGQVFPVRDKVVASSAVPSISGAPFDKKLCDFLARLEAGSPGSGKTIGCLLKEKAISDKGKKVGTHHLAGFLKKKSFKGMSKKSGVAGKASAAA